MNSPVPVVDSTDFSDANCNRLRAYFITNALPVRCSLEQKNFKKICSAPFLPPVIEMSGVFVAAAYMSEIDWLSGEHCF